MEQIKKVLDEMGVQYVLSILEEDENGTHVINTEVNVNDGHHMMDMVKEVADTWWESNH